MGTFPFLYIKFLPAKKKFKAWGLPRPETRSLYRNSPTLTALSGVALCAAVSVAEKKRPLSDENDLYNNNTLSN